MAEQPKTGRILLLGGPVGPFFTLLASALAKRGEQIDRCILNPGDRMFGLGRAQPVSQEDVLRLADSGQWKVAAVFGVDRTRHKEMFKALRAAGVNVLCLEEGYIRPGFVSAEWNGSHDRSPLKTGIVAAVENRDSTDSLAPDEGLGHGFLQTAFAMIQTTFIKATIPLLGGTWHRNRSLVGEVLRWPLGYANRKWHKHSDGDLLNHLVAEQYSYRVFALQVHDDTNLVHNGNGLSVEATIDLVIKCFVQTAPADEKLLFKIHPFDAGHMNYRRIVAAAAKQWNCVHRVHAVCDVPLGKAVKASSGLVTVNSTSGLSGLHHAVQTDVLGRAFYEGPGLARFCAQPDIIWSSPHRPDRLAVMDLWMRIYRDAIIPGSFYALGSRRRLATRLAQKLLQRG